VTSEQELQSKLDLPRSVQRRTHLAPIASIESPGWRVERGVIDNVKELGPKLHLLRLSDPKTFDEREVNLLEGIGSQDVSPTGSVPAISSPRIGWEGESIGRIGEESAAGGVPRGEEPAVDVTGQEGLTEKIRALPAPTCISLVAADGRRQG